ncbi:MAG: HD domain-containing protein [Syntrophaceae bacterium]|nr:HD domain-containing protein [Syntrophaceae bacterium]
MTKKEQGSLQIWFDHYVDGFRDQDGVLTAALKLKYQHSRRVADNARLIAEGLGFTPAEILLTEGCGLLHDIGRFPQYALYGSFHDASTMDHGAAGRQTLEKEGLSLLIDADDWTRMACAVEYHNRKTANIPQNIPDDELRFLKLIRDADKLDIMDLVMQSVARDGFSELPDMLPHIRTERELTPLVMEEVLKTKTVSVESLHTVNDFLIMLASWFYDFNYTFSMRLAISRNIIRRLERELPDTTAVRKLFADIKKRS